MLEAFLTPSYVAELRIHLSGEVRSDEMHLKNLWLLTPSMHQAFRAGHVAMNLKIYPTIARVEDKEMVSNIILKAEFSIERYQIVWAI